MQPSTTDKNDALHIADGVLRGVADESSSLDELKNAIARHRNTWRVADTGMARQTLGIEIGAAVAKFFVKRWTRDETSPTRQLTAKAIVDVKRRLAHDTYRDHVADILDAFDVRNQSARRDWLVPPGQFDFSKPERLLEGAPDHTDIIYVYGTRGPRAAAHADGAFFADEMRILSGDEEALLIFDAVAPRSERRPGTMVIEIGAGSTELALIGRDDRHHVTAFAVGGAHQAGLDDVVTAIATGDIKRAAHVLESPATSAQTFLDEVRLRSIGAGMFINPNKSSAAMRASVAKANDGQINVDDIRRYADEDPTAPFAAKAKILAKIARALGIDNVREGTKGGLKEALGQFIGRALATTLTPPAPRRA
jgi:hypothetical protein